MMNLIVREIFGQGNRVKYSGNTGRMAATTVPNTPEPPPYTTYNNLATRGAQQAAGLYPTSNGMTMSPDGTKVYSVNHNGVAEGFTNDAISQYDLSVAWDLSTMSALIGASPSLNSFPSFSEGSPQAAFFSPDGLNLFVSGSSTSRIFKYILSTAYVASTATADSSLASGFTGLAGLSFSQDGTKMFLVTTGSTLKRYTLSIAWDITTAIVDQSLVISGAQLFFQTNGLAFFTYDGSIKKYILATAWDLTSLIIAQTSIALNTLTSVFGGGVYLSTDGTKFFMSNYMGIPVKRFELSKPFKIK